MKFVYIVVVGYIIGVMFILGISVYYLLKGCDVVFVCCLFVIVVLFGMVFVLFVIVLGDELGYEFGEV